MLAILYAAVSSDFPRVILIDEPQSFLHPGAIRKLVEVLMFEQTHEHQYIMTSHSPVVVASCNPGTILLVQKNGPQCTIQALDGTRAQDLRILLADLGVRLSDVFGADNILWVEGKTEEQAFPLILSEQAHKPLLGTVILGVVNVGDLEGRFQKRTLEIYRRLSSGGGLLPPSIGFVLDSEDRSDAQCIDLIRQYGNEIHFLPRRMFENYLLNPKAISELIGSLEGFVEHGSTPPSEEAITDWVLQHRKNPKYYKYRRVPNDALILEKIHGADLLANLFREFSEARYEYDKIEHGIALTRWVIENAPEDFKELAEFLSQILDLAPDGLAAQAE